jgi:hypothetical protein
MMLSDGLPDECTFVDERGAVGIRLEPAAAIGRRYGDQFATQTSAGRQNHSPCYDREWRFSIIYFANCNPLTERATASLLKVLIFDLWVVAIWLPVAERVCGKSVMDELQP